MIIITAIIDYESEADRDRALQDSTPFQQATRDEEPGCRSYCFAADPCVSTRIQVYECWDKGSSVAAHFRHENYANMKSVLTAPKVVSSESEMHLVSKSEPVYNADGQIRETFFDNGS